MYWNNQETSEECSLSSLKTPNDPDSPIFRVIYKHHLYITPSQNGRVGTSRDDLCAETLEIPVKTVRINLLKTLEGGLRFPKLSKYLVMRKVTEPGWEKVLAFKLLPSGRSTAAVWHSQHGHAVQEESRPWSERILLVCCDLPSGSPKGWHKRPAFVLTQSSLRVENGYSYMEMLLENPESQMNKSLQGTRSNSGDKQLTLGSEKL